MSLSSSLHIVLCVPENGNCAAERRGKEAQRKGGDPSYLQARQQMPPSGYCVRG